MHAADAVIDQVVCHNNFLLPLKWTKSICLMRILHFDCNGFKENQLYLIMCRDLSGSFDALDVARLNSCLRTSLSMGRCICCVNYFSLRRSYEQSSPSLFLFIWFFLFVPSSYCLIESRLFQTLSRFILLFKLPLLWESESTLGIQLIF